MANKCVCGWGAYGAPPLLSLSKGKGREMGECLTSARVIKALHWYA